MKYKTYRKQFEKMGKRFLVGASSSIVAGMLIMGSASNLYADTIDTPINNTQSYSQNAKSGMHMMHRWNSHTKAGGLAAQLGLDPATVKAELKSGKTMKQILQDNGIVPGQLQKAFDSAKK
jgi:hypothetical protein